MQEKNHYAERVMSGNDAVSEYFKLKARLSLTQDEKENFRLAMNKKTQVIISGEVKRCSKCGLVKPLRDFYTNGKKLDGSDKYHGMCKVCLNQYKKFYQSRQGDIYK